MTRRAAIVAFLVVGCGSEAPPSESGAGGGAPAGCVPGEAAAEDGSCIAAGIPECGEGFEPDGEGGCVVLLPSSACPAGELATPGDTSCRPPAACGRGTWGDAPIDATTEHVDASYAGMDSDGSAERPWRTIQDAVDATAPSALVAVAAGSYVENVAIAGKAVRLFGRCPELVEIVGVPGALAAVLVTDGADGTEIRSLSIRGAIAGIAASGSQGIVVEGVWIVDTESRGIDVEDDLGPTEMTIASTLVESTRDVGIYAAGAVVTADRTMVRATRPNAASTFGNGIQVALNEESGLPGDLTLSRSVLDANHDYGLYVVGSTAAVETTVVTGTLPQQADNDFGRGIGVQNELVSGTRGALDLRTSIVAGNTDIGIHIMGADAVIDSTVVRGTKPNAATQRRGRGVEVSLYAAEALPATLSLQRSVLRDNREHGLVVFGALATVSSILVRDTQPRASDGLFGRGITVQLEPSTSRAAEATITDSRIVGNADVGVLALGATVKIVHSEVSGTAASGDGSRGDGIAAVFAVVDAAVDVDRALVAHNVRAGISTFGAAVAVGGTTLECHAFHLNGQPMDGRDFSFEDRGGNRCGCDGAETPCKVLTTNLVAPEPID